MTETTQPDPQVVAEPAATGAQVRGRLNPGGVGAIWIRTTNREQPWRSLRTGRRATWGDLTDIDPLDPEEYTRREFLEPAVLAELTPLTVADVPAGQGPASLFIAPADVLGYTDGNAALWIQTEDGPLFIRWASKSGDSEANRAMWDHLAATLPHVTTGEGA